MSTTVQLDRKRDLRFDFNAFLALDEVCKINVYQLDLRTLSPGQVRDLVWAGQLHTEKALPRDRVGRYMPTDTALLGEMIGAVVRAVAQSYGAADQGDSPTP